MTRLSPESQALFDAERDAPDDVPDAIRSRMRHNILAQVAASAAVATITTTASTAAKATTATAATGAAAATGATATVAQGVVAASLGKVTMGLLAAGAMTWGVWQLQSDAPNEPPATPMASMSSEAVSHEALSNEAVPREPRPSEPASTETAPSEPAPSEPAPSAVEPSAADVMPEADGTPNNAPPTAAKAPASAEPDTLNEQAALLMQTRAAMGEGRYGDAQKLLHTYRERYGDGALAEDQQALSVMARCGQDPAAGREAAAQFHARFPRSPLRSHVDKMCGVEKK